MNFVKKILVISFFPLLATLSLWAHHIKGGEIYYTYMGPGAVPNSDKFLITLRLFISCESVQGQLEESVNIGIYRNADNQPAPGSPFTLTLGGDQFIRLTTPSPCIINPSDVCYRVRIFTAVIDLPKQPFGYTAVYQRCCRIDGINNLSQNINVGASYICKIHGTNDIGVNGVNSNPQFLVKDTVLICQRRPFTLNFGAFDEDGDSLSFEFTPGFVGGSTNNPVVANPPPPRSIPNLSYKSGFTGFTPLGPNVTIDPKTGIISGIAPASGDYVVCVQLNEWRNGKIISSHPKDFIVHIDDRCDFASANLKPAYITCDGFNYSFKNEAPTSPLIHSYFWDFGIPGTNTDTSTSATPNFTFPDTGTYKVKLYVNKGEECSDSATTLMKVYPGFFPGFIAKGSCLYVPLQFTDTTKTKYGRISGWSWTFGDQTTSADTSSIQNPTWRYSDTGTKKVSLIVSSDKGCTDTVTQNVQVLEKPPIDLAFHDTLICSIDTLELIAKGSGIFTWSPNIQMLRSGTPNPLVYPKTTTTYTVGLNQNGCINTDTVRVRVVDFVTLNPGNDTTICLNDTIRLNPSGDGLYFTWSPPATLDNPNIKNPKAVPTDNITVYHVIASIGKCNTAGDVTVFGIPYPGSNAGNDTTICFADTAQLDALIKGSRFVWSPANELSDAHILNPYAFPLSTTTYSLYVYDTLGCPKPGISSVTVNVKPLIIAFAGNDTSIVIGQPLQLSGKGAPFFSWSPPEFLNQNDIPNPVTVLSDNFSYVLRAYDEIGCFGLDTINIKVFKTGPDIFVPNAFTPGKNINNIFRPIPVGISTLTFFRIYNRQGQLVFSTSRIGAGWDGTVGGRPQDSGGYVWMVRGTDYTGKLIVKKGTMVLIR
ncbi:MAG: gliding motility-associated C-terminal domain-containing protein [Bacteroidetes bacterium]|nr:gliding motility-associated C-terminal domain-containing protein [Bacteroidota bacterium]